MTEQVPLSGGNQTVVVRAGATVRRSTGPWTPAVHALLSHLEARGFDGAPWALGVDEEGREVLAYIEGETGFFDPSESPTVPASLWSDEVLVATAGLLRRLHEATGGFKPPIGAAWRVVYPDAARHEIICHNDFAYYNLVYRGGLPRAVIDFDMAGPGPRAWDVAYAAYRSVPLYADLRCVGLGADPVRAQCRRLRLFCDAYGLAERADFAELIVRRVDAIRDLITAEATAGNQRMQQSIDEGHLAGYAQDLLLLDRYSTNFQAALEAER
ncbi:MAG: phosphotransferase [Chloroflexota bacterium]